MALSAVALLTLGVVMVNSAMMGVEKGISLESVVRSQSTLYMGLALLALLIGAAVPFLRVLPGGRGAPALANPRPHDHPLGAWTLWPMWLGIGLLLAVVAVVYVPGIGHEAKGSHRWLRLSLPGVRELSVQPSELAKWGLIPLLAWTCWAMGRGVRSFWTGMVPVLAATGLLVGFVALEDLGTAALMGAVAAILLVAAGAKLWHFIPMLAPAAAAGVYMVLMHPYRLERIKTFLDPYQDPQGAGFHVIQSMAAIAGGGGPGRGLGHGLQKMGYLPEDHSDFVFSVICEELGVGGASVVVALYLGLLWAGYLVVRKQVRPVFQLVALGVLATLGLQALINIGVVTGMLPTKGIALPLLSSGGTGWILTAFCLGLVVWMDRAADRDAAALAGGALLPGAVLPSPVPTAPAGTDAQPGPAANPPAGAHAKKHAALAPA